MRFAFQRVPFAFPLAVMPVDIDHPLVERCADTVTPIVLDIIGCHLGEQIVPSHFAQMMTLKMSEPDSRQCITYDPSRWGHRWQSVDPPVLGIWIPVIRHTKRIS